jgi:hypothetical protein
LKAITGKLMMHSAQGTLLSILLARAISIAAAEKGEAKKAEALGTAGEPGRRVSGSPPLTGRSAGVIEEELVEGAADEEDPLLLLVRFAFV